MRSRIVQLVAIALMLSACTKTGSNERLAVANDRIGHRVETSRHDADPSTSSVRHARQYPQETARHHHPHEPTPEEEYAATIALLISAQIFACAFIVVILDGSCNFYASTGYYY